MLGCIVCFALHGCGQASIDETEIVDMTEAVTHEITWQQQYDLGLRYLLVGRYEDAVLAFCTAIQIDPKQSDV